MFKFIRFGLCLILMIGLVGCYKEDVEFEIPTDLYEVSLEKTSFVPLEHEYTEGQIKAASMLTQDDYQFVINDGYVLQLGRKLDTSGLDLVEEYDYGENGIIREYSERTGNYKVLVAVQADILTVDDKSFEMGASQESNTISDKQDEFLVSALTISRYVSTYRGVHNGMTLDQLDAVMGDAKYAVETKGNQEKRVYEYSDSALIISSKHDVVRSLQLILTAY